jgi:glyoxylate reductase
MYTSRTPLDAEQERALNAACVDKDTLLAESDLLSIHCPLSKETRHAFGAPEFKAMKKTACLINTARGPVVDEAALAKALDRGDILAAGLDVFEDEPAVHPDLLQCQNAVLIPHLGSASHETRSRMAEMAAKNIVARLDGETPPNCINPEAL